VVLRDIIDAKNKMQGLKRETTQFSLDSTRMENHNQILRREISTRMMKLNSMLPLELEEIPLDNGNGIEEIPNDSCSLPCGFADLNIFRHICMVCKHT